MKWRCRVFFAGLLASVVSVASVALAAPPRLWFEARVEPSTVPVNAQATYVQRFGHAVDVRAPRLDPPHARLAEILPLGPVREFEQTRDGVRYLIHEQRFAILPFASGELQLDTAVHGTTPARLAETGNRASFTLHAPTVRLTVTPARSGANWLPARTLRLGATGDAPAAMKVGEVWTRQLLVEAVGVDGAAIAAPHWRESADWTLQFDPPEVGRRIEDGEVIGFRRQVVHAQPRRAGRLEFPLATVDWWPLPIGAPARQTLAPAVVEVLPAALTRDSPIESASGEMPAGDSPTSTLPLLTAGLLFGLLLVLAIGLAGLARSETFRRNWRRHRLWKQFDLACRANDPAAARQALRVWARECCGAIHPGELPALSPRPDDLRSALQALDAACYGPPADNQPWDGGPLRRALRGRRRSACGAVMMAPARTFRPPNRD